MEDILRMDKHAVTRTISFGGIYSETRTSGDFSAARRHSSAGIRARLWATGNTKSFGCPSDLQTSRENMFSNILTPYSIPQFTIPTLSVQTSFRSLETEDNKSEGDLRSSRREPEASVSPAHTTISSSSSSSCSSLVPSNRKAERCVSDPLTKRRSVLQREVHLPYMFKDAQHSLDPESKAALSLPHLTKVTTSYGFVTLSQSPQMASEEALLCQAGLRRLHGDTKASCSAEGIRGSCFHQDSAEPQREERSIRGEAQASISASLPAASAPSRPETLKRRFYHIIKKHFM